MLLKKIQFPLFVLLISALVASCSLPKTVVKAPLKVREEFTVGNYKVIARESSDSVQKFFAFRYYPVYHFAVVGPDGKNAERYVGAWQEFLARFSGSLREHQKELLQGFPLFPPLSDSAQHSWSFPLYEGEVSELKNIEPVRVSYWSLDKITGGDESYEALVLGMLAVPNRDANLEERKNDPAYRENLLKMGENIYGEMKKFLILELQKRGENAAVTPAP
jgi:hypothetical protein